VKTKRESESKERERCGVVVWNGVEKRGSACAPFFSRQHSIFFHTKFISFSFLTNIVVSNISIITILFCFLETEFHFFLFTSSSLFKNKFETIDRSFDEMALFPTITDNACHFYYSCIVDKSSSLFVGWIEKSRTPRIVRALENAPQFELPQVFLSRPDDESDIFRALIM
jgi:hypothetical protein